MKFRYGNYRITKSIENSLIHYRAKAKDNEGNVIVDDGGDIVWEDREFNIKNKVYVDFPEELKKKFNEYQIETVIHENSDMGRISKLIKRYNNHTSMNASQRAFTYISNFAREVRKILDGSFFLNCGNYTQKERDNGTLERVVLESVMGMFYLNDWKKEAKKTAEYLNNNAAVEDFKELNNYLEGLAEVITPEVSKMFNSKDTFLWMGLYRRFLKTELSNEKFVGFLTEFSVSKELKNKEVNGTAYIDLCINKETGKTRATKDKYIIVPKLDILETLMLEYLGIPKAEPGTGFDPEEALGFVKANVVPFATKEDIEQYAEVLESLLEKSNCGGKLLEPENKLSLVGIVAYSFENDIDLDNWIVDYCDRNSGYIANQAENYEHMKDDLQQFMKEADIAHTDAA